MLEDRFWSFVSKGDLDQCWPWQGPVDKDGYGNFHVRAGELRLSKNTKVHANRLAFRLAYGRWPVGYALHGCDNPACCNAINSDHIHEGSPAQNMQEKVLRNRHPAHMRNGNNPTAKLTWEQAEEIRRRYATGEISQRNLAEEYGIEQSNVSLIVNYKIYRAPGGVCK